VHEDFAAAGLSQKSKQTSAMNHLTQALAQVCRDELIREKWLVAPSLRVGHQWLDSVALGGQAVLNTRVKTFRVLAMELAAAEMARTSVSLVSSMRALVIVDRILDRLDQDFAYLSSLPRTIHLCSIVLSAITSLRLARVESSKLDPTCFEEPAKAADLKYLLDEYASILRENDLVDYADVLRIAAQELVKEAWPAAADTILLVPEDIDLSVLERALLESISRERIRYLAVDQPEEKASDENGHDTDVRLLRWLSTPSRSPKPFRDGTALIFHAIGEINEVREVLRRCIEAGHNLDQVELLYTDPEKYIPLIYETFLRLQNDEESHESYIPVTFAEGIPIRYSRPARALTGWVEWVRSDYSQAVLVRMIHDGLLEFPDTTQGSVDFRQASGQLRGITIGFGRDGYVEKLKERLGELEQRVASSSVDDSRLPFSGELDMLKHLSSLVERLLFIAEGVEAGQEDVIKAAGSFLTQIARRHDQFDNYSRKALLERIDEMAICLAHEKRPLAIDLWEWLLTLPREVRVGGSGPRPGRLHCAHVLSGGHSGRKHTFIIGLDDGRFPGVGLNDPLLLDNERLRLSSDLPTTSGQLRHRLNKFSLLLARLRGTITMGFSSFDLQQDRAMFPSPGVLSAYRILSGSREGDQSDLMRWLSLPATFVPSAGDRCLDQAEWWLWRMCGTEKVQSPDDALGECFPHLMKGLHVRKHRESPEFTIYDGFLSGAFPELDPTHPSGPVVSAAMLETIGQCALKYFLRYVLKVKPPEEVKTDHARWLDPAKFGDLLHEVLYRFMSELMDQGRVPLFQRDIARLIQILDNHLEKYKRLYPPVGVSAFRRQQIQLLQAVRIFLAEEELLCRRNTPKFLEVSIGMSPRFGPTDLDRAQPVTLRLPDGRTIRAQGRLDRMDEIMDDDELAFSIHDYKSGSPYKYTQTDPYWQGRVIQHALYLQMAAAALSGKVAGRVKPVQFEYFFPGTRTCGLRVRWRPEQLSDATDIIKNLCDIVSQGSFLATTNSDDCTFCDYMLVCKDVRSLAVGSKLKLENLANTMLDPIRKLRNIGNHES